MSVVEYIKNQTEAFYGPGSDKSIIEKSEILLKLSFSDEYKNYLNAVGIAAVNGHELTGISESERLNVADVTLRAKEQIEVPDDFYVVEETGIDGIIIWQNSIGEIYATQPGLKTTKLNDSLLDYLQESND